jgi:hypothetical protein
MATRRKSSKRRPATRKSQKLTLAAFFRALWKKPELLDRFSADPQQRAEVLQQFNLTDAHRRLLQEGCVRHIIQELAGVKISGTGPGSENTVIFATADVTCNHPECRAFMSALKPT